MTLAQIRLRLEKLGYGLDKNKYDGMGNKFAYRVGPISSGGSTSYFDLKAEVIAYLLQVEKICSWQSETSFEN